MNRLLSLTLACFLMLGLAACDKTIRGAGQDIEDSANAVGDAVD